MGGPVMALLLGGCGSTAEQRQARPEPSVGAIVSAEDEPPREPEAVATPEVREPSAPTAEPPLVQAGGETIEALRIGGEVLVRQPALPWMTLAASHVRTGSTLRVTLRYEVDPFGPRDTASVRWLEPRGAWTDADFVGSWARSGSIPSPGGAIGWRREYALRDDGTYTFSAYPPRSEVGTWRRVDGPTAQITLLQGSSTLEAVGLVRDPAIEPSAPGPLRHVSVRVVQSDAPPPSDTPSTPTDLVAAPVAVHRSERDVTTDAEGVLTFALDRATTTVTLAVGTQHVTLRP